MARSRASSDHPGFVVLSTGRTGCDCSAQSDPPSQCSRFQIGAVSFSDTAHVLQPPTADHEQVRLALAGLTADGGTAT